MEHEIIQDLLPLYHDGVCSNKSRAAVEEHLKECADCRRTLADMDTFLPETKRAAADDAAVVKGISQEWEKDKWRARVKGAIIAAAVCLVLAGTVWFLTDWTLVPVTDAEYTVEAYQLESGAVGIHWEFEPGKETRYALVWKDMKDGRHWYLERPILRSSLFSKHYNQDGDVLFTEEDGDEFFGLGEETILLRKNGRPAPGIPRATEEQSRMWGGADQAAMEE